MGRAYRADATQLPLDHVIARLASSQFGVFGRDQARRAGATKGVVQHRVATGRWDRVEPDVFRFAGTPPSWRQALMVACLAWGEGAVVSHRAAAALWQLAGFEGRVVELTVPRDRRRRGPGIVHRTVLLPLDVTRVGVIPVTTPACTLIDIASVATREVVEQALDDALRRGMVSIPRLRWRLDELGGRGGRAGVAAMRSLVASRSDSGVPHSVLETRLLRLLNRARLPKPVVQHGIHHRGRLVGIVDVAFPHARLAIEADGYRWHSGRRQWQHDRLRRNELTLLGWRVIHVSWADMSRRPEAVIASIRRALAGDPSTVDRTGPGR